MTSPTRTLNKKNHRQAGSAISRIATTPTATTSAADPLKLNPPRFPDSGPIATMTRLSEHCRDAIEVRREEKADPVLQLRRRTDPEASVRSAADSTGRTRPGTPTPRSLPTPHAARPAPTPRRPQPGKAPARSIPESSVAARSLALPRRERTQKQKQC